MKFAAHACLCFGIICALGGQASAQNATGNTSDATADAALAALDATQTLTVNSGACVVAVTLDKDAAIQDVDKFRTDNLLNSSYSDDYFLNNPAALMTVLGFESSSVAVDAFFSDNPSVNKCHFKQFLGYTDNYGNDQSDLLFSMDFDRALFNKINWGKFNPANLPTVSHNYVETPIMQAMEQLSAQSSN
jgi:hypothetical protein